MEAKTILGIQKGDHMFQILWAQETIIAVASNAI